MEPIRTLNTFHQIRLTEDSPWTSPKAPRGFLTPTIRKRANPILGLSSSSNNASDTRRKCTKISTSRSNVYRKLRLTIDSERSASSGNREPFPLLKTSIVPPLPLFISSPYSFLLSIISSRSSFPYPFIFFFIPPPPPASSSSSLFLVILLYPSSVSFVPLHPPLSLFIPLYSP